MAIEQILNNESEDNKEEVELSEDRLNSDLRPKILSEYIGQREIVESLKTAIKASEARKEPMDHVLFHGPPGLGKTTLAHVIAKEKNTNLVVTSGPSLERPADIVGLLSNLDSGDVLFIDEIHRLSKL